VKAQHEFENNNNVSFVTLIDTLVIFVFCRTKMKPNQEAQKQFDDFYSIFFFFSPVTEKTLIIYFENFFLSIKKKP